jgi:hypothetical protein
MMKPESTKMLFAFGITLAAAAAGCGKEGAEDFADGVPQQEDVKLVIPAGPTQAGALTAADGTTAVHGALLGEKAEFYTLTRDITVMVNTGTASVLTLVKTITGYPPSSVAADTAVWGPFTDPLSPNTFRLTVNRLAPGQFHYVLDGKPKTAPDTAFVTVLSGTHNKVDPTARRRANTPDYGSGDFLVDWDAMQTLPEHDTNVGKAAFTYSRLSPASDVNIGVTFTQVLDNDTGKLIDATYGYTSTPGMGGSFDFEQTKDIVMTTAALEQLTVHSRWQETGAGRADTKITGGDLAAAQATLNECWDSSFLSVYFTTSWADPTKSWGDESACAFVPAVYSAP